LTALIFSLDGKEEGGRMKDEKHPASDANLAAAMPSWNAVRRVVHAREQLLSLQFDILGSRKKMSAWVNLIHPSAFILPPSSCVFRRPYPRGHTRSHSEHGR
jgi:hypothetical protein